MSESNNKHDKCDHNCKDMKECKEKCDETCMETGKCDNKMSKSETKCECDHNCKDKKECDEKCTEKCKDKKECGPACDVSSKGFDKSCSMLSDANKVDDSTGKDIEGLKNISVETSLTTKIPKDEIVVEQLKDGFKLKVQHSHSAKAKNSWYESAFSYSKEEHYGREVESVEGKFNEKGNYTVDVKFKENK